ncbi:MAG: PAS domain S-box protein [Alphaproteobacteria bacterium]|nr:PAS domain S-box protein [Alphaproteobacteria bacterium]
MTQNWGRLALLIYMSVFAGMLALSLALYFIGIRPLADHLAETYHREIHDSLADTRQMFREVIRDFEQAAARLSGRRAVAARQIAFLQGQIDLADLVAYSIPQLADSLGPESRIRGVRRYGPDGSFLFAVGEPAAGDLAGRCVSRSTGVSLLAVRDDGAGFDFIYCSPIRQPGMGLIGFDVLRMDGSDVYRLIERESNDFMSFLLTRNHDDVLIAPPTAEAMEAVAVFAESLQDGREAENFSFFCCANLADRLELHAIVDRERYFGPMHAIYDRLLVSLPLAFAAALTLTMLTVRPLFRALDRKARQAHERRLYQELFLGSNALMLLIDPADGRIVDANPAAERFYGYDRATLLAMTIQQINTLSPDAVAAERRRAQQREANSFLFRHRLASGDIRVVEVHSTPLSWDGARLLFSVIHDMTERKRMEDALVEARRHAEEANAAKSAFIAAMSHELRSPLNVILGFSEVIHHEMFGPVGTPRYRDYAADIHRSGSHLIELIDDLLDLAKIEAGRFKIAPEPVDPGALVADCLKLVGERARNHGLTVDPRIAEDLPALSADPRALRQMLFNLLSNAIKFTPAGGRITVSAVPAADGGLVLSVADTGIGMSPEDRAHLFEPFYRAPDAERRHIEGTGLGLALVRSLMEQHGGRVTVDSAPGQGSVFRLVFPPGEPPGQAAAGTAPDASGSLP